MDTDVPRTMEFDICGQLCPATLLVAMREINANMSRLNAGTLRLLFKTDNRGCTQTIPEAAGNMGLKVSVQKIDHYYAVLVSR